MDERATIENPELTTAGVGGRPMGSKDSVTLPARRLRRVMGDLVERAEGGDAAALATLAAAVLLADGRIRGAGVVDVG